MDEWITDKWISELMGRSVHGQMMDGLVDEQTDGWVYERLLDGLGRQRDD